jgi:hypothetical protein
MKKTKPADASQGMIDRAVEASVHPFQWAVEAALLATLATVIRGDQADLKSAVLALNATGFPLRDHRAVFAATRSGSIRMGGITTPVGAWPDHPRAG